MRRQKWKDELTPVVIAAVSQFVALRVVDWANANKETNENAANLVGKHFYYAPQILAVVIIFFTVRSVKVYLDEQGIRLGSFLRQSVLAILLAAALIFVAHIDQLALLAGTFTGEKSVVAFANALEASAFYGLLSRNAVLRLLIDLVALVVTLVSLRYSKLPTGEGSGRSLEKAGDFLKAGEAYLKENNLKKAKAAFRKAKAPTRLAALELRDGNPREAARLFEEAGDTFAWEAALAWGEAGDREKAEAARVRALADARNMSRWDRLAEIADATGDVQMVAEASRRLAEGKPPGAGRTGLFRRAGESYQQTNQPLEAAEAYRGAGEFLLAAEMFQKAGRHADASTEFERGGDLARAAQAATASGNGQRASELTARDAEARGDVALAAQAWREAGQLERAANLFERKQLWFEAAEMWMSSKRPDKAGPLFQRAGRTLEAAVAFEEAGAPDKAAPLFRELGHHDRAAILFRSAGRWVEAAQSLQIVGQLDEALGLYRRAGRGLEAARCALQLGHREQAWELVSGVPRGDASVRAFFVDLAEAHVQAGEYRDAVHVLREHLGSSPVTKESLRAHLLFARGLYAQGEKEEGEFLLSRIADVAPEAASELQAEVARGALSVSHHPTRRLDAPVAAGFVPGRTSGMHTPAPPAAPVPLATEPAPGLQAQAAPEPGVGAPAAPTVVRQGSASFAAPRSAMATGGQGHSSAASPTMHRATPAYGSPSYPVASTPGSGSFPPLGLNVNATGSAPVPTLAGAAEDRYDLLGELGRGGMGVVHKALDRKLDRYVALKILPWQLQGDETAMRYFQREARAIAALKHPNIVQIYDYGEGFGSVYLAMEFLEGPNLQNMMRSEPARLRDMWREYFEQAARGVAAAHSKGILHRDLKPANLMLDEHGTLRILDFGLARQQTEGNLTSKLIGTPAFFPPEVLRGEPPTPASDVYSLGATFYTLVTGRWPYVGDDVLVARLEREPDDPRPFAPHLRDTEVTILMKALARHRPERYPDAGELLAALLTLDA